MDNRNQWLTDLGEDEDFWAEEETFETIPSMITELYKQLKRLAQDGNVYGVMLQCKYLYESLYRVPVIMSLIIIDSCPENRDVAVYSEIVKASLGAPLTMGLWDKLAGKIQKSTGLIFPESIRKILECTADLYDMEVSSRYPDVINWRNSEIGHGALRFEDDQSYREEIENLLEMLKDYFEGDISNLYGNSYFLMDEAKLTGENSVVESHHGNLVLWADGKEYPINNYAYKEDIKYYLFDSYYVKKDTIKYSSFADGQDMDVQSAYFKALYEKYVATGDGSLKLGGDFITRQQEEMLEYLNMPIDYIKPKYLTDTLKTALTEEKNGVISIFMERGTGKSAFANRMSGLYHSRPLIGKDCLCRCYHVQNAAIRGINDFFNSVNFSFRHSFDHANDLAGSTGELISLNINSGDPSVKMAEFLNSYHRKYGKSYTIFLIDGIDELTEKTCKILDFVPSSEQLEEGVFVILLSRFKDEETVLGSSKRYIEKAEELSRRKILIKRDSQENKDLMMEFIKKQSRSGTAFDEDAAEELIRKSDHRFLYLKAYVELGSDVSLNSGNEYDFFGSYMNHITSLYGTRQMKGLRKIAATIALFPSVSLSKYQEYLACMELTFEFLGQLNDLMPMLTVLRANGEDIYEFADAAYVDYILTEYKDEAKEVIDFFYQTMERRLHKYLRYGSFIRRTSNKSVWDVSDDKLNEMQDFFIEGVLEIYNRGSDLSYIREKFFENNIAPIQLCAQVQTDSRQKTGQWVYLTMQLAECLCNSLKYCIDHKEDENALDWCSRVCDWIENGDAITDENYEDNIFGTDSYTINEMTKSKEFRNLSRFVVQNWEKISPKEWFWLITPNISDETIEVLLKDEQQLIAFIDYCDEMESYQPEIFFRTCDDLLRRLENRDLSEDLFKRVRELQQHIKEFMFACYRNNREEMQDDMDSYADIHRYIDKLLSMSLDPAIGFDKIEEFLIKNDTRMFYGSLIDSLMYHVEYSSFVEEPRLYCTNNVIFLLNEYNTEGETERFEKLMKRLERDIAVLDSSNSYSPIMNAKCEIQKFIFMRFRKDIGYSSEFDAYLSDIAPTHMAEAKRLIESMSGDTNVTDIEYEIELLMEYSWHTCQYEAGCSICDELLDILKRRDCGSDPVVRGIQDKEIELVSAYKMFFSFLSGDGTALPDDSIHYQGGQIYEIEFTDRAHYRIRDFFDNPAGANRELLKCGHDYSLGV